MNKTVTFIIPLHKKDMSVFEAIESVPKDYEVVVSCPTEVSEWLKPKNKGRATISELIGKDPSYQNLVNNAVQSIETDYVSILEYDDILTPKAMTIFNDYIEDLEDADAVAGLVATTKKNGDDETLISIGNEGSFAPNVAETYGEFDYNMMLRQNFTFLNGMFIKPEVFQNVGLLKPSLEMNYDYEFVLRMVYEGAVIKAIPKITHYHRITPGGAFEMQQKKSREEIEFWLKTARKEYFFKDDRGIKFIPSPQK